MYRTLINSTTAAVTSEPFHSGQMASAMLSANGLSGGETITVFIGGGQTPSAFFDGEVVVLTAAQPTARIPPGCFFLITKPVTASPCEVGTSMAVYGRTTVRGASAFSPASLFSGGEQGGWYDYSDMSTLFQDSAGSTPVTAVEQPIGRVLDKSGRGNHLIQATSAARPAWSARKNLIERTDDLANALWSKTNVTVAPGVLDPDGGSTAFTITSTAASGVTEQPASVTNIIGTMSVWMRRRTGTGTVKTWNGSGYVSWGTLTSSWQRLAVVSPTRTTQFLSVYFDNSGDAVDVWRPQIETVTATPTRYQRVTTSTDYDTVGFPHFARFDGVDDSLNSAATFNISAAPFVSFVGCATSFSGIEVIWSNNRYSQSTAIASNSFRLTTVGVLDYAFVGSVSAFVPAAYSSYLDAAFDVQFTKNGTPGSLVTGTTDASPAFLALTTGSNAGSFYMPGQINQLVILGRAPTAGEVVNTDAYITAKTVNV